MILYLNVSARTEVAPDQGLLREKGGTGFPYVVLVGRDFASEGLVELRNRRSGEVEKIAADRVPSKLLELIVPERNGL